MQVELGLDDVHDEVDLICDDFGALALSCETLPVNLAIHLRQLRIRAFAILRALLTALFDLVFLLYFLQVNLRYLLGGGKEYVLHGGMYLVRLQNLGPAEGQEVLDYVLVAQDIEVG